MLTATQSLIKYQPELNNLKGPLLSSTLFHGLIIILMIVGIPFVRQELPPLERSISVELVQIDDKTQTNKKASRIDKALPKPLPKTKPKAEIKPKPRPEQNLALKPPKPLNTPKPKTESKPVQKPAEKKEAKPEISQKVEEVEERKRTFTETEKQDTQEEEFKSLLRNISPEAPSQTTAEAEAVSSQSRVQVPFSQRMTMSEQEALKRQLSMCWRVLAGTRYAEDIVIKLRISVGRNRIVQTATVVDQIRYNTDRYFKAAADSTLRAVRHPDCTPLKLPEDKYEQWKTMNITFDPREML